MYANIIKTLVESQTQTDEVKHNLKEVDTQTLEKFTKTEDFPTQSEESSINNEIIETKENGEMGKLFQRKMKTS